MSVKRSLYRTAPVEHISKEKRHSLSQGRLVSKPSLADSLTVYASPGEYSALRETDVDGEASVVIPHEGAIPIASLSTPPRQVLSSLSNYSRLSNDATSNPRLSFPSSSYFRSSHQSITPSSPPKPKPTHTLDLSDSDPEVTFKTPKSDRPKPPHGSPVVLVDASGGRKDLSMAEVEVKTDIIRSPVKVICHVPTVIDSDLRNSGYVANTARIAVDSVPTMSLLGDIDVTQEGASHVAGQEAFVGRHKQPIIIKEKGQLITGSESVMDEIEAEITRLEKSKPKVTEIPAEKPSEDVLKEKKKKQRGRAVQSRYKQQTVQNTSKSSTSQSFRKHHGSYLSRKVASNKTKPVQVSSFKKVPKRDDVRQMKSFNSKSYVTPTIDVKISKKHPSSPDLHQSHILEDVRASHQKSSKRHPGNSDLHQSHIQEDVRASHKKSSKRHPGNIDLHQSHIQEDVRASHKKHSSGNETEFFYTPMRSKMAGGVTSTPAATMSKMPVMLEESIIAHADASSINQSSIIKALHNQTAKTSKKEDITQAYLDRIYTEYLQWLFLDSKARKAFQEQEKEAMSQLYGLWSENEKLRKRQFALKLELERVKHNNMLDKKLHVQREGLGPVVAHCKTFQEQFRTLARGVDTTRHQLATSGIFLPENEDFYQDELQRALNESQKLLGEISLVTSHQKTKLTSFANASETLEKAVENELKEIARCQELLTSTTKLATQESSIKMQQIQHQVKAD
ncbi:uncharacterized protein [Antedon mediterranea]|uniref:uncharacterized protein n=1 Tax=Antedon mediterranea TaxID=105859 RepID=UPI003AF84084